MKDVLNLAKLKRSEGFWVKGTLKGQELGYAVVGAGDLNGDGVDDVVLSSPASWELRDDNYLFAVMGQDRGGARKVGPLSIVPAYYDAGEMIIFGEKMEALGDVDGDGIDDLLILSRTRGTYVFFGMSDEEMGRVPKAGLNLSGYMSGFYDRGPRFDSKHKDIAGLGDVNGDGFNDFAIAFDDYSSSGPYGKTVVVFGREGLTGGLTSTMPEDEVIEISGVSGASEGGGVAPAGDLNNDGVDDFMLLSASGGRGKITVVFGRDVAGGDPAFTDFQRADLTADQGFTITESSNSEFRVGDMTSAGDINGDGIDDLLIGGGADSVNGRNSGVVYVLFGRDVPGGAAQFEDFSVTDIDAHGGFRLIGANKNAAAGGALAGIGDFNGDGVDDFLVGAEGTKMPGTNKKGVVYLIYGRDESTDEVGWRDIDLGHLDANQGMIFTYPKEKWFGYRIDGAGDINNDGYADIVLGQPDSKTGIAFVVYGHKTKATVVKAKGDEGDNLLEGFAKNDRLDGRDGHDTLFGKAGKDKLKGGDGDDDLRGGDGKDTLKGDAGSDALTGGADRDTMSGGLDADTFVYLAVSDSAVGSADLITDFDDADMIDLSALDPDPETDGDQMLSFIEQAAFTGAGGEVRYELSGKKPAKVFVDLDGDLVADMQINVKFKGIEGLTEADFIL